MDSKSDTSMAVVDATAKILGSYIHEFCSPTIELITNQSITSTYLPTLGLPTIDAPAVAPSIGRPPTIGCRRPAAPLLI
jgi:hypothetical protein